MSSVETRAFLRAWQDADRPTDPAIIGDIQAGVRADLGAMTDAPATRETFVTGRAPVCIGLGHHARAERRALAVEAALWIAALLAAVGAVTLMLGWWPR